MVSKLMVTVAGLLGELPTSSSTTLNITTRGTADVLEGGGGGGREGREEGREGREGREGKGGRKD